MENGTRIVHRYPVFDNQRSDRRIGMACEKNIVSQAQPHDKINPGLFAVHYVRLRYRIAGHSGVVAVFFGDSRLFIARSSHHAADQHNLEARSLEKSGKLPAVADKPDTDGNPNPGNAKRARELYRLLEPGQLVLALGKDLGGGDVYGGVIGLMVLCFAFLQYVRVTLCLAVSIPVAFWPRMVLILLVS